MSNIIDKLKNLEKENIIKFFKFKKFSSWIEIKNYLYANSLKSSIKLAVDNRKDFLNKNTFNIILLSITNYFKSVRKKSDVLFVGAGSGIFEYENEIVDEYLPNELEERNIIYFASADYPDRLLKYKAYLHKNSVIIHSFLVVPFRILLSKFLKKQINIPRQKINALLSKYIDDFDIDSIFNAHIKFIANYYIYKILLKPFRLKRAYIVSAYTNSSLIAVLKEKGVEVIEIQHGFIGPMHRGYNYAFKSSLLPAPDKIYVYDDFWKNELIDAGFFEKNQIIIKERKKYSLVKKDLNLFDKKFIVFTGQGGFYDKIAKFLKDNNEYILNNDIYFIYLPHPNEINKDLSFLEINEHIKVLSEKKYITEQYIYNSLAHISVYSSCHFDAIHFKGKTFILDVLVDNPLKYYINKYPNRFFLINSIKDVFEKL